MFYVPLLSTEHPRLVENFYETIFGNKRIISDKSGSIKSNWSTEIKMFSIILFQFDKILLF